MSLIRSIDRFNTPLLRPVDNPLNLAFRNRRCSVEEHLRAP
jgi:hypothetical protein